MAAQHKVTTERNITRELESTSIYIKNLGREESNTMWKRHQGDMCMFGWWNEMVGERYGWIVWRKNWMKVSNKIQNKVLGESETSTRKAISGLLKQQPVIGSYELFSTLAMNEGKERRLWAVFDCLIYEKSWPKTDSQWFHLRWACCLNCNKLISVPDTFNKLLFSSNVYLQSKRIFF